MEKHKMKYFTLIVLLLSLLVTGCNKPDVGKKQVVPASTEPVAKTKTIYIFALGDNLLHMPVVNSGKRDDGTYEYSHLYANFQPEIKLADLAVIGQETVFGGADLKYSGYPMFNSPSDMGKSLVEEGFDVILHASNHVLDRGAQGVENTLEFWDEYPDTTVLGINKDQKEQDTVEIVEVKGAKLSLLNYTYGTNGIPLPAGKEYLVNCIDEDKIESDAAYAEKNADFTIAFMHWGTEYSIKPDSDQKALAEDMCEWGVDLIIGSHPHVIEPVEWIESDNGNRMLVYYSLGNYVSRQLEARNLLGGIADVALEFDGEKVVIDDYAFIPIVTHYNSSCTDFAVYPLSQYTDELAKNHGVNPHDGAVSVERWTKMLEEVFEGYDTKAIKDF